ncbi:FGGY-family carbohydrate kinase [Microbacterium sp. YY-01]|uniref:FGGY-family carbohydrate kinase n=1 Tax=Microbacterium sp. YY-01 TaxID=3421634 RepID=UPI003D169060
MAASTKNIETGVTLGIDIGTSGTKLVCVDRHGRVQFELSSEHATEYPAPGWAEQDADDVWWRPTARLIRSATERVDGQILAVGVSGLGPCLLPVDSRGQPLRKGILYGVDNRSAGQVRELTRKYTDETLQNLCSHSLSSESVGPKIAWVQEEEPAIWRETKQLHTSHTHVVHRLTGAYVLDHTSASLWDPLYNPWNNDWNFQLVREFGVEHLLPDLKWPNEIVGYIHSNAARITGLAEGTPVIAGAIDFAAELAGIDATEVGDGAITYGTTLVLNIVVDQVVPGKEIWTCVGLRPGRHLLGGVTSCAGALTSWLRRIAGDPPFEELIELADSTPIGSNGLLILPYFSGERTPIFDPDARGVICGLTLSHGVGDLYRGGLEAQGFAARHILEELKARAGVAPKKLIASGGGVRHPLGMQIVSDCTGVTQSITSSRSGAPFGVAILAHKALNSDFEPIPHSQPIKTVTPDAEASTQYDALYEQYRQLDHNTRAINHRLGQMTTT